VTRTNWTCAEIAELFDLPFTELVFRAAEVHRAHHAAGEVQLCTLLSIKTGGCPEDCGYCAQSAHAKTGLKAEKLMDVDAVLAAAREAKAAGSQRFCMGAAWREPKDRDMPALARMVAEVKALGLETCMTLGMLTADQARALKAAGSTITTTISTPRPNIMARSSPPAPFRSGSTRWRRCAPPASPSAAAGSSAWAKAAPTASASSTH
jgi:biotin synthase